MTHIPEAFRVDPALDGVPDDHDVLLPHRELLAGRDPDLLHDHIYPRDRLGDGMLRLDARVHLDEVERALVKEELECAGADMAKDLADLHASLVHPIQAALADPGAGASSIPFW